MIIRSALVETNALAQENIGDFRIIETAMARDAFDTMGHIPYSVFRPASDFFTPDFRLRENCPQIVAAYAARYGITSNTTVVCTFGETRGSAWAAWLFWLFTNCGHENCVVLDGGTPKWRMEERPIERLKPEAFAPIVEDYAASFSGATTDRATFSDVSAAGQTEAVLLDTRSREEFDGIFYFDAPPKNGERAGRIKGALHLPHDAFLNPNGTFRSRDELQAVCDAHGLNRSDEIITYCTVGIRSAMVWFVLKQLLGFPNVSSYDGSWNEWSRAGVENGIEAENIGPTTEAVQ